MDLLGGKWAVSTDGGRTQKPRIADRGRPIEIRGQQGNTADRLWQHWGSLDGKAYKHIDDQWTFDIAMLADWGASGSLCEALWTACETAPNTTVAVSLTAATGAVFAFNVLPVFPSVGGTAPDAQTVELSFTVVGTPTETFS